MEIDDIEMACLQLSSKPGFLCKVILNDKNVCVLITR